MAIVDHHICILLISPRISLQLTYLFQASSNEPRSPLQLASHASSKLRLRFGGGLFNDDLRRLRSQNPPLQSRAKLPLSRDSYQHLPTYLRISHLLKLNPSTLRKVTFGTKVSGRSVTSWTPSAIVSSLPSAAMQYTVECELRRHP